MPQMKHWKPGDIVQALVYGYSKTGKTFGAATFPRPNFICFDNDGISTVGGRDFLTMYPGQLNHVRYELFTERSRNAAGVVTAHNAFDDACRYFDQCMRPSGKWTILSGPNAGQVEEVGRDMFDTWVIDSGTTMSEAAMNKALILLGGKQLGITSHTQAQALATGLVYPKQQDYGSERSMMEQMVQMVMDAGKHFILICHEKEVRDQDTGNLTAITPLLTGKGVQSVCLKFDEIWNLRSRRQGKDLIRELSTTSDGIRMAGSRYGIADKTQWNYEAVHKQLMEVHTLHKAAAAKESK